MIYQRLLLCLCFLRFLGVFGTDQVLITLSEKPPTSASKPVVNNFVSLSIAIHWFQDYARIGSQGESPNIFSRNLLTSLQESTSLAPEIRIGGTSADRTTYVPSQTSTISEVTGDNGIPLNVTLNQQWFSNNFNPANFPAGTQFIFDLPLVRNDSLALNNTLLGAQWALEAIGGDRLNAFEIGNEEDLYPGEHVVPPNWAVADYATRWKTFSSAVLENVLIPHGLDSTKRWFQGLVFAGLGANQAWTTQTAFNAGVDEDQTIKSVSLHNYPAGTAPWVNLGRTFMNHDAIVANLSQVIDDITFLQSSASTQDIVFNVGETNIDFTNLNMDQFEGVLGSALWTIDYLLYGASLNINRMYMHQGTTFGYAAWQPVATNTSQPKVRAPWYGLKFAAEAIGSHQGPIQIASLGFSVVNGTGSDQLLTSAKLSAYAIYESASLARIALINFNEWNSTGTSFPSGFPRPSVVFKLSDLTIPGGLTQNRTQAPSPPPPSSSSTGTGTGSGAGPGTGASTNSAGRSMSWGLRWGRATFRRIANIASVDMNAVEVEAAETGSGNITAHPTPRITLRRLTAPTGASADSDITFGGIMWNYTTQGLPQAVAGVTGTEQVVASEDGSVLVEVGASEAVLIQIN